MSVEAASAARGDLNKAESFLRVLGGPGNAQGLLPLRMSGSQMPRVIEKKLLCMIPKCFLMKKKKKTPCSAECPDQFRHLCGEGAGKRSTALTKGKECGAPRNEQQEGMREELGGEEDKDASQMAEAHTFLWHPSSTFYDVSQDLGARHEWSSGKRPLQAGVGVKVHVYVQMLEPNEPREEAELSSKVWGICRPGSSKDREVTDLKIDHTRVRGWG